MTDPKLTQFRVLIFDVYATLVDWETGIYERLQPLLKRAHSNWSKQDALLAFTAVEKDLEAQHPDMLYADLLARVHESFAKRLEVPSDPTEDTAFGQSIQHWPVFPDTISALESLSKHYKLTVLSNVDRLSFSHTRRALEHGFTFSSIVTAQDIGSYKPNPANYEYALNSIRKQFGVEKDQVLVVAQSLTHDHVPANALGIATVWIDREGACMGINADAKYVWKFKTLGEMAEAVERDSQAAS